MEKIKKVFKWNRFVGVSEFRDVDKKTHILVWTRNAMYEYDPTGTTTKGLFTLKEAEDIKKGKDGKN